MTRAIIETAVDRGIRDITNDPKRSLRRLADMGKQYSTGRFQKLTFSHITNLLRNDDSPYYKMLEDFLATVDHEAIKTFGLNIGYDSWTYGARVMRASSEKCGFLLPWAVIIHYAPSSSGGLSASDIDRLICRLNPFGVNTFVILKEHRGNPDPSLIELFKKHRKCCFFLFLNDNMISMAEAEKIRDIGNTVISVNIASDNVDTACKALKKIHALYVIHYEYASSEVERFADIEYVDKWLTYGSAFIFLFQKNGNRGLVGGFAKKTRMDQNYPILIWDVYADIQRVESMIYDTDSSFIFEVDRDGNVRYPEDTGANIIDTDIMSILDQTAPRL